MKKIILFIFTFFVFLGYGQVSPQTFATPGTGSFKVPCGVSTLTIECWGAGGGGGGGNGVNKDGGGGGGGGAYSKYNTIAVTPGTTYNYTVGTGGPGGASGVAAGGTSGTASQIIIGATTYFANGGTKGNRAASGAGGAGGGVDPTATVKFAGGAGAAGLSGTRSGGGGEGASAAGVGNPAVLSVGGTGNASGGDGGDGGTGNTVTGGNGVVIGGGGGGGSRGGDGGSGANGQITLTYGTIIASNAGTDQAPTCSATTATLVGNTVGGTTGLWTCITNCGGVTFVTPTSPTSVVNGLSVGTASTLRWTLTVTAGGCTTTDDVIITPTAFCPPVNDDPSGAIPLTVGSTCSITTVTNLNATSSTCGTIPNPTCGSYVGGDVWFSVTVPASGVVNFSSALGTNTDPQIAVYSGSPCGVLTQIDCDDDSGLGFAFALSISGQTPGTVLLVRCWRYNTTVGGTFDICVTDQSCPAALTLVVDAPLVCGQNTQNSLASTGECKSYSTDISQTKYYRFTATNDSLVVNLDITSNASGTNPITRILGPFASGAGCSSGCTSLLAGTSIALPTAGEFGYHGLLTGLATTGNHDYLIQVEGNNNFSIGYCISVANPASNNSKTVPSVINNCGITFNGTTAQAYYISAANGNLDGNNGTTCGTCAAGYDVPYAINNDSWFKFCSTNAGTYNVQFDVGSCLFTTQPGVQMAILTGTTNNFTNVWNATNPTLPSTAVQTSPNFNLAAGGCAYLVVDGWNGDECSYSYVLTNVSGGCILLPIELLSFNALQKDNYVDITWATATEKNNEYFTVERSLDGMNFEILKTVKGSGTNANAMFYSAQDNNPFSGLSYYRLKQTDFDGKYTYSNIVSVDLKKKNDMDFEIVPNPNNENESSNIIFNVSSENNVSVSILDVNGISVYEISKKMDSNKIEIPSHFSKGIYFVKVISSDTVQTKRMVIK